MRQSNPFRYHGKRQRRGGYVMLIVMMLILTTSAMAAVHARHLNSALRIEQARIRSEAFNEGPVTVLAVACQRLETGDPPSATADYRYSHSVDGVIVLYRVQYANIGPDRWSVTAEPDSTASSLTLLPSSFGG